MAKGRQRGNRELKKPKAAAKKPVAGTVASQYQLPVRLSPGEESRQVIAVLRTSLKDPSMKFRPLQDRIVVRRITAEEKSSGGIIIPDTVKEKPIEGEVVAVGPGARDEQGRVFELDVKGGDRVVFGKWSGTEVKIDGEELLIMKESDVMGVVQGKPNG